MLCYKVIKKRDSTPIFHVSFNNKQTVPILYLKNDLFTFRRFTARTNITKQNQNTYFAIEITIFAAEQFIY